MALLNYRVPRELLAPYVPRGVELDEWGGSAWVSVVGFQFRRTRVLGVPIPLHRRFDEVNLRFYARRVDPRTGGVKRGVTFIRELVPRAAVALVARATYNEPYLVARMRHEVDLQQDGSPTRAHYAWNAGRGWSHLELTTRGGGERVQAGSEEEFFAQREWGFTRQRDGGTIEYEVVHPRWRVWRSADAVLAGDLEAVYGTTLARALAKPAESAFVADGSPVTVHAPARLRDPG